MTELVFLEEPHQYFYGDIELTSVTTVIHKYTSEFKVDEVVTKMMQGCDKYCGRNEKYIGMTSDEIKAEWIRYNKESTDYGTAVHLMAEQYIKKEPFNGDLYPNQLTQIKNFFKDSGFECHTPEIQLYSTQWRIAGTADLLLKDQQGKLHIFDWKTNRGKDLSDAKGNQYTEFMKYPVSHLPDLPFWHYAIQMSIYRILMETEDKYEDLVDQDYMAIVHIKEEGDYPLIISVPYLKVEALNILKHFNNIPLK